MSNVNSEKNLNTCPCNCNCECKKCRMKYNMDFENRNLENQINNQMMLNHMLYDHNNPDDYEVYMNLLVANISLNICCFMIIWTLIFSACKNTSLSCMIIMFFGIIICLSLPTFPGNSIPRSYYNTY